MSIISILKVRNCPFRFQAGRDYRIAHTYRLKRISTYLKKKQLISCYFKKNVL